MKGQSRLCVRKPQCEQQATEDLTPTCGSQRTSICYSVLARWGQDWWCQQTEQASQEGQHCGWIGAGKP